MLNGSNLSKQYVMDRVEVNSQTKCWEWKLSINPQTGYGQIGIKPYTAHRLAYSLWVGDADGLTVRHACHNRICCNPAHLRGGSVRDNYLDSLPKYMEAWQARRGVAAKNAIEVEIAGMIYPSKVAAMKALRVGPTTLDRLIRH